MFSNKLTAAITCLQKAIDLNPNDPFSNNSLGMAFFSMNRVEEAMDKYQKAIEIDPKYISPYINLA